MAPAYLVLVSKGFTVRSEGTLLVAEKGDDRFIADNPLELLGLISVGEERGENWIAANNEIDAYLAKFGYLRNGG